MAYLITFGIAVAFKERLVDAVREKEVFYVSFDESFNKIVQQEQMDTIVSFWQGSKVVSRYLDSAFLGHTKSEDLLVGLKSCISELNTSNLVQIGMDGPNVNLKLHRLLVDDRRATNPEMPDLIDIGTCSLHVVHGGI